MVRVLCLLFAILSPGTCSALDIQRLAACSGVLLRLRGDIKDGDHSRLKSHFAWSLFDRSQARSLLSMAILKVTRSRQDRAISRRTRMDRTCFGWRNFFWLLSKPLIQGRRSMPARTAKHEGSSATVLRVALTTEQSGSSQTEFVTDRFRRKAAIPKIGCVRCGTCYAIEMISRF
jgi:hypothetical protein